MVLILLCLDLAKLVRQVVDSNLFVYEEYACLLVSYEVDIVGWVAREI